jgi:hypothetical protein
MTDGYNDTYDYLMVTQGCQKYNDRDQVYG